MMELNTFVKQAIEQIFEGVKSAQDSESTSGGIVNPLRQGKPEYRYATIPGGNGGLYTTDIDFDVSVVVESGESGSVQAGIFIFPWAAAGKVNSDAKNSSSTRISFSVPVVLPNPEKERLIQESNKARNQKVIKQTFG